MTTGTSGTTRFWQFLLALAVLLVSPLLEAQFNTPAPGGVTSTLDTVSIGTASPQAKLHVLSSSNTNVFSAFGPNGNGFGVTFTDTQASEGYPSGIVANFTGNSIIRISGLQIGQWSNALVQSTNGAPLLLNASAVTGSPAGDVIVGYNGQQIGLRVLAVGNSSVAGKLGVGTSSPSNLLTINQANNIAVATPSSYGLALSDQSSTDLTMGSDGTYAYLQTWNTKPLQINNQGNNVILNLGGGNVGIGKLPTVKLDVAGDAHFSGIVTAGIIQATYQDVAEWVPAAEALAAGTVVVVGEDADNTVTSSSRAYDTSVAGVVSANPGLLLGIASATKAKIATTGRVRVRVDATKSPIRKGDLLATSDRPGMAMKSEPLDLGGVRLHRPGTLIGKALEPLAGGEGEILVLLSLQ